MQKLYIFAPLIKVLLCLQVISLFFILPNNIRVFRLHARSEVSFWPLFLRLGKFGVGAKDRNSAQSSLLVRSIVLKVSQISYKFVYILGSSSRLTHYNVKRDDELWIPSFHIVPIKSDKI